ncbi:MAG: hypothetical protein K9J85_03465 [Desulfobacteraceae bacterium]|nr:hypothetical protein [Desulfobacteraceae bacterium]
MKKVLYSCIAVMMLLPLMACSTAMTKAEAGPWLAKISGDRAPEINVDGRWQDANADPNAPFSWGKGFFDQQGNQIEGSLGKYNLQGKVTGDTVYLVLLSAGEVHYTARLKKRKDGILRGNYFYEDDSEQKEGIPMALERVEK